MAFGGQLLEIQIRTKEMNYIAEYGVAAHWAYKADSGSGAGVDHHMDDAQFNRVLTKLKSWSKEIEHSETFMTDIKDEILKDSIYVFTPQGHIVELSGGATALDFAYQIHTEVGNHTIGAKADGQIIPLDQPLKNTQVIEILTSPSARPHVQWLRYAKTTSARRKIRAWLNKYDENVLIDNSIIAKRKAEDEQPQQQPPVQHQLSSVPDADGIVRHVANTEGHVLKVGQEKNMMIHLAQCCHPVPGDPIVGYISRGQGITVHRADCPNVPNMEPERIISVHWDGEVVEQPYDAGIFILAKNVSGMLASIARAIAEKNINISNLSVKTLIDGRSNMHLVVQVRNATELYDTIEAIRKLPGILEVVRDDEYADTSEQTSKPSRP